MLKTGSVHDRCRFTASPFGNSRCATLWLTITTGSLPRAVLVGEVAAGDDRDAEHGEEARRDHAHPRARILFAVRRRVALDGERKPGPRLPASRQGTKLPTATPSTPGSSPMRRVAS